MGDNIKIYAMTLVTSSNPPSQLDIKNALLKVRRLYFSQAIKYNIVWEWLTFLILSHHSHLPVAETLFLCSYGQDIWSFFLPFLSLIDVQFYTKNLILLCINYPNWFIEYCKLGMAKLRRTTTTGPTGTILIKVEMILQDN